MLNTLSDIASRLASIELQTNKIDGIEVKIGELMKIRERVEELESGQSKISESVEALSRKCDDLSAHRGASHYEGGPAGKSR